MKISIKILFCILFFQNIYAQDHAESINAYVKAANLVKDKQYQEALPFFNIAIAKSPKDYAFVYEKGKCLMNLKDYQQAIKCFETSILLNATNTESYTMLAYSYQLDNQLDNSLKTYNKALLVEKEPAKKLDILLRVITLLTNRGKSIEARTYIDAAKQLHIENETLTMYATKLVDIHKENLDDLYNIAFAHYKVYDIDRANQVVKHIFSIQPDYKPAHLLKGKLADYETDKSVFINQLQNSITQLSNEKYKMKLLKDLIEAEFEQKDYAATIKFADNALQINSQEHDILFMKALALDRLKKPQDAIKIMQSLVSVDSIDEVNLAKYNFELGLLGKEVKNNDLATTSFQHANHHYFKDAVQEELGSLK
jgi:tetratricopeptide (TPR) repeat protein